MAASDVEIVNNALYLLGDDPIADFDEGSERANLYRSIYPISRDAIIRAHRWRFSNRLFGSIAEEATKPPWKWDHAYTLSPDPYVLRVFEVDGDREGRAWAIYGRSIYTNLASPINYEAGVRVTDPSQFDSLFEDALTFRLAAAGAMPLTESRSHQDAMMAAYVDKMREARTVASQEGYPEDTDAGSPLLNARLGSGDWTTWRKIKPVS